MAAEDGLRGGRGPDGLVWSDGGTLHRIVNPDPAYDCRYESPGAGVFDWRSTVAFEHCGRIVRLGRLSHMLSDSAPPEFFEGKIDAARLPPDVGISMPLLRVVFPERVFFDTDEVELRPEGLEVIEIVARYLKGELPDVALFVAGHADRRGSNAYNLDLSSRRANAIAEAIVNRRGSRGGTVWRVGFGEDMPLYAGDSDLALGYNRRIEFYLASRVDVLKVYVEQDLPKDICFGADAGAIDSCRAKLDFADLGYTAREVLCPIPCSDPGRPSITPPAPSGDNTAGSERSGSTRAITPSANGGIATSPSQGADAELAPAIPHRLVLTPRRPKEIVLMPRIPRRS